MSITIDLSGKTAFVSGSSRGIGRAIGLELARAGAAVIFHGRTESEELSSACLEAGSKARFVCGDLCDPAHIDQWIHSIEEAPDILVLNGSVQSYGEIKDFNFQEFQRQMTANVAVSFRLIQTFYPAMCQRGWGRVIAIGSINQERPTARFAIYSATKAALANLVRGMAKPGAACGVTFNSVLPGVIATDRNAAALKDQVFSERLCADIPAHRFGTPEDCAPVVAFLCSNYASYISGAEIPVAGAWQL